MSSSEKFDLEKDFVAGVICLSYTQPFQLFMYLFPQRRGRGES